MGTMIQRRASRQWRKMAQPFAMIVVIISLFGMLPIGLTDVAAQNQQEAKPQQGQQADQRAAETTYLEIHLAECPAGFEAISGQDYYDTCHANAVENVDVHVTSVGAADKVDETVSARSEAEDGPGIARFEEILPGDYKVEVAYPEPADASYFAYCSIADGDDEIAVTPNDARNGELSIPEGQAAICDWYLVPGASDAQGTTINLTGFTCETGAFEPGSNPSVEELTDTCTTPADGVEFTVVTGPDETEVTANTDANGETTLTIDPTAKSKIYANVELEADEWMYCSTEGGDPSQVTFDDQGVWNVQPESPAQLDCTWFFAAVPDETPAADETPAESRKATSEAPETPEGDNPVQTPADEGQGGEQGDLASISISGFDCLDAVTFPNDGTFPAYEDLAAACTTPIDGFSVKLFGPERNRIDGTTADSGQIRFTDLEPGLYQLERNFRFVAEDDAVLYCSIDGGAAYEKEINADDLYPFVDVEAEQIECSFFAAPVEGQKTPKPTTVPTADPTAEVTPEPTADVTVESSASETNGEGGNEVPAGQQPGQQGPAQDLGRISVLPTTCPQDFDPEASGVDYASLVDNCSEPLSSVSFNFTAPDGSVYTDVSNGQDPLVYRDLAPGTYTLYSDIPLEAATEYLFCSADGGNRYQKDFSSTGVTTFEDLQAEQISCEWFVVQNNLRGEETGASLEVHYAECPAGYTGDNLFDDCHGNGVAGQKVSLNDGTDEVSTTTVVEQDPGPGIVRFTSLGAGEYTLKVPYRDQEGTIKAFCNVQPSDEKVDISVVAANGSLGIGENEHVLCDWYFIPDQGSTPTPPPEAARAEIIVTLYSCPATDAGYGGATLADFSDACTEKVNDVPFTLGDPGATPLTANTGASGDGAVRFFELLPGDYTMSPRLPENLTSSAVFCTINDGNPYQKALGNGTTTFVNVDGESISCDWYAVEDPAQAPTGPSGLITIRQRLCEGDSIKDYDAECAPGASGSSFTLASADGAITLDGTPNDQGVYVFSELPNGFYAIKQNDGQWCKAVADRVDSKSRVIVADGGNTDVVFYQCGDVKGLPTTGTGPAGTVQGDDQPLLTSTMWAIILGLVAIPLAAIGIFQTRRYRKQVQVPVDDSSHGPVVTPSGRVRMRFR